jgi:hypothetical protein
VTARLRDEVDRRYPAGAAAPGTSSRAVAQARHIGYHLSQPTLVTVDSCSLPVTKVVVEGGRASR